MSRPVDEEAFASRAAQRILSAASAIFLIVGLATLGDPRGRVAGAAIAVFGLVSLLRARRAAVVTVSSSTLTTRSIVRTRRFPMASLIGVEVEAGRIGMNPVDREYLTLHFRDGTEFGFKDMTAPPPRSGESNVVRDAAEAINRNLHHSA